MVIIPAKLCMKCGKFYFYEHKVCKPKTQLEYRKENYNFDKKLGVW